PHSLKKESQNLLNSWRDGIIKLYEPEKITFLDFLPISHEIMEMALKGEYIFPESDPMYEKLNKIVDTVIEAIDEMKKVKLKEEK
ncbi:MAG: hypothetical protein KAJ30_02185, partial [Candidatus Heimdallarchaeota archaeon]|nr:hypothetical protein [Candidatus Heimdallarchaeota archaeon]